MSNGRTKITFKEQMEGFPLAQIIVISCVRLAEPIAFTSIFPYAYFMIRDFGIANSEAEISQYAGYLASIFALCQIISAIFWGKLSDVYGRKVVIMCGLTGCLLSLLLLGFSKTYWVALLARGLMGLLNGNSAVVRCVIGEIATDKKHQGIAFLAMPVAWNIGGIFGPWIGGNLSHPKDPSTQQFLLKSMNETFPYALPNIVIAIITMIGVAVTYIFLEETHPQIKYKLDTGIELRNQIMETIGIRKPQTSESLLEEANESTSLLNKDPPNSPNSQPVPWNKILKFKSLNPILSYFIMQAHFVVFNEFLPIFVSISPSYDNYGNLTSKFPLKLQGGLGYSAEKAGSLLSSAGFFGIIIILVVFPWIDRTFNRLSHLRFALGSFPILFFLLPFVLLLLPEHIDPGSSFKTTRADIFLYAFVFIRVMFASSMGPIVMMVINNNAPQGFQGTVNGLAISASAMAGCLSPIIWGQLMSVGQKFNIAWLEWWTLALLTLAGYIQGFFLSLD